MRRKKFYEEPVMEICVLEVKDIITLSNGGDGDANKDSFDNIFDEEGGWYL